MMLHIPHRVFDQMCRLSRSASPLEACGYLAGKEEGVERLIPMRNVDESETHFSFAPEEQFAAAKSARRDGLDLIGVYHSHPSSPARPSAEDIRLAYDPTVVYVILSLLPPVPDLKAFRIKEGEAEEVPISIIPAGRNRPKGSVTVDRGRGMETPCD